MGPLPLPLPLHVQCAARAGLRQGGAALAHAGRHGALGAALARACGHLLSAGNGGALQWRWHAAVRAPPLAAGSGAAQLQQARAATSGRGELPREGPRREQLAAVPFSVSREQADAAFKAFHSQHWLQNPSLPRWRRAAKESYLPFWVGDAHVEVEVLSAELGRDELVREINRRTGRYETRLETVWRRVALEGLRWRGHYAPEDPAMQLYAAWKYPRADVEALRPGPAVGAARAITPDMLEASPGSPSATRYVGAFTLQPDVARRLLASRIESAERRRAEEQVAAVTGHRYVRFVELALTWLGPAGGEGPRISPVYAPAYIYSWIHGGIKVRTLVSGADGRASGAHHLDDTKVAVLATAATSGALLLSGAASTMTPTALFVAGVAVPFIASGLLARFWPAVRHLLQSLTGRLQQAWHTRGSKGETDWTADFVGAYSRQQQQGQQQQQQQQQQRGSPPGGEGGSPGSFQEFMRDFGRDPWAWMEREARRQAERGAGQQQWQQQWQEQQQRHGPGQQYGNAYEQRRRQQQQQQQRRGAAMPGVGGGPDPLGLYARLGVKPGASREEISSAFRGLALQALTEAYQVLRDPARRQQYDATGRA
ncbi:MAG: hypothetical protein J3K34DRAFT_524776 [Monoraphidium minutum]|nr:MAG: hypothetical protein J3K34DRAFT_524776 [Monoraphidium minutum]